MISYEGARDTKPQDLYGVSDVCMGRDVCVAFRWLL